MFSERDGENWTTDIHVMKFYKVYNHSPIPFVKENLEVRALDLSLRLLHVPI